jgi:hypothetical protein
LNSITNLKFTGKTWFTRVKIKDEMIWRHKKYGCSIGLKRLYINGKKIKESLLYYTWINEAIGSKVLCLLTITLSPICTSARALVWPFSRITWLEPAEQLDDRIVVVHVYFIQRFDWDRITSASRIIARLTIHTEND